VPVILTDELERAHNPRAVESFSTVSVCGGQSACDTHGTAAAAEPHEPRRGHDRRDAQSSTATPRHFGQRFS
jgi:hypothetical protein